MRLTTKGRFAVTAMLDLTMNMKSCPATLASIGKRQNISLAYLEQLFAKLRRHGLVMSSRGPGGGYSLAKAPELISIADIIVAVDESLNATQCNEKKTCTGKKLLNGRCMTHELWASLNKTILDYLKSISLHDLVEMYKKNNQLPNTVALLS